MAKTLVETVYGKYAKYEIIRNSRPFSTKIELHKDGKYLASYSSVEKAVAAAKKKG